MRGDLYRLRTAQRARGHEQRGSRYAVVVQSDWVRLSTLLVAPTSTSAHPSTIRPLIDIDGTATLVMIDQTTAVDPARLGDHAGRLSAAELAAVDDALRSVLGLA